MCVWRGGGDFTLFDITIPLYKTQDQKMEEVGGCFTLFDITFSLHKTPGQKMEGRGEGGGGAVMLQTDFSDTTFAPAPKPLLVMSWETAIF